MKATIAVLSLALLAGCTDPDYHCAGPAEMASLHNVAGQSAESVGASVQKISLITEESRTKYALTCRAMVTIARNPGEKPSIEQDVEYTIKQNQDDKDTFVLEMRPLDARIIPASQRL